MNRHLIKFVAPLILLTPIAASAVPVFQDGQLTGATEVEVNGALYDLSFDGGTCIALFSGCDETSDFFFQNSADALAAAYALLDQVLVDGVLQVDSSPALMAGCSDPSGCFIYTPYSSHSAGPGFAHIAMTFNGQSTDYAGGSATGNFAGASAAWAVWSASQPTPAPEPGTLLLLTVGILGLGGLRKTFKPA